jgi:iron-sulfur cluster assembly protein
MTKSQKTKPKKEKKAVAKKTLRQAQGASRKAASKKVTVKKKKATKPSTKAQTALRKKGPLVHKNMMINDVVGLFPEAAEVMTSYGLHCVGCGASGFETLEEGFLGHGFEQRDFEDMLDELNEYALGYEEHGEDFKKEVADKPELAVSLTEKAAKKFRAIAEMEGKAGMALRVDAAKQGCCDMGYALNFESDVKDSDVQFGSFGVEIVVSPASFRLVKGAKIDFEERKDEEGFKVHNPNEKECGCG